MKYPKKRQNMGDIEEIWKKEMKYPLMKCSLFEDLLWKRSGSKKNHNVPAHTS
jgi:hypothetical protein